MECQVNKLAWTPMLHWSLNIEAVIWSPLLSLWSFKALGDKKFQRINSFKIPSFLSEPHTLPTTQGLCSYLSHLYSRVLRSSYKIIRFKTAITLKLVSCSLVKCSSSPKTCLAQLTSKLLRECSTLSLWWRRQKAPPWIRGRIVKLNWSVKA